MASASAAEMNPTRPSVSLIGCSTSVPETGSSASAIAVGPRTSMKPSTGATPSTMTPTPCKPIGSSIQRLTSPVACTLASRAPPRKTTPKARVMLSAETAPTKASSAPAAHSATLAQAPIAAPLKSAE